MPRFRKHCVKKALNRYICNMNTLKVKENYILRETSNYSHVFINFNHVAIIINNKILHPMNFV